MLTLSKCILLWLLLINIGESRGDELTPVSNPINVKETQTVTLAWRSDFPLSKIWYLHVRFRPPGQEVFGNFPIATLVQERPDKNDKTPKFFQKITTVSLSEKTSNSFVFKVTISNMAITEEGEYKIIRLDPNGDFAEISSIISAGVIVRPRIDPFPKDVVQQEDHDVKLKCTITAGNPKPLTFRWLFTPTGKDAVQSPLTDFIKAVDTVYYNMTKITYKSKGKYTCVVSNGFGESDSHDINLSVLHRPYIASPLMNITVFESDGTKEMNCDARGNPSTDDYYWYKGPQRIQIKSNTANIIIENENSRLRFYNPKRELATLYSCAGENKYGIGDSKGAYLIVTYIPEPVEFPEISNKAANVKEGHNITVRCYSDAVPAATYSWYRKYKDFRGQVREEKIGEDNKSGLMTLHNVMINDTGEYKCVAYNYPDGKNPNQRYFKQDTMMVKVMFGPLRTNVTVNGYNQSHEIVQVKENNEVIIECKSESEPPSTYIIQHGNTQLNSDNTIGYHKIDKMTVDKDGDYVCIATNQDLGTKETRVIKVLTAITPKSAQPYPTDMEANEGATVRMECNAEGRPAPNVFWTKDGLNVTSFNDGVVTSTYKVTRTPPTLTDNTNKLYRIQAVLTFTGIRSTDEGYYQCVVHNGAGREIIGAKYTVNYAPKFLKPLQNYTVKELTSDIVFTCSVNAKPDDNILYRWFFNGIEQSVTTSTMVRKIAKRADSGKYMCQAKNLVGSRNSTIGLLLVSYAPKITFITPRTIVDPFQSTTLRCQVNGVPAPLVTWSKDNDPDFKYYGNDLTLQSIKNSDKGLYICEAKNSDGGDSRNVVLLVRHKPVIATTSPAETKIGVDIGDSITLNCRADGYPLPKIFWREKGASGNLVNGVGPYTVEESESDFGRQSKLKFVASSIGSIYVCTAQNELDKSDSQEFQVLGRGPPEPPVKINKPTDQLQTDFPIVVNITISWVPGFSGGYPVKYTLYYREKNDFTDRSFEKFEIGPTQENKFFFTNRKPSTTYELAMAASNLAGKSVLSQAITFKTRDAPPPVAEVDFVMGEDRKSIIVTWLIVKDPVPVTNRVKRNTGSVPLKWKYALIRYQVVNSGSWKQVQIDDITGNGTHTVTGLDQSESYNIHFVLYDTHGNHATPVGIADPIRLGGPQTAAREGLSQTDIIAIAVGCGGAILLVVVILLFVIIHKKNNSEKKSKTYNDPRVQVDIPVNTMRSNYSGDVVRSSYMNEDDPYTMELTDVDDSKSPPPGYDGLHHYADPPLDYGDNVYRSSGHKPSDEPTPSYTSFGRISKKDHPKKDPINYNNHSQSMNQLNNGSRAAEISRGNERHRYSLDNLDDYPEDASRPLIQNNQRPPNVRTSRGRLSSDESMPEPPAFMKDAIRSPPSDEGALNRAPGAFGDRAQRFKKPPQKTYDQPPPPPPNGFHQGVNGRDSPAPSSVASSKPYRSDNEYIDEQDDKYVGFLV